MEGLTSKVRRHTENVVPARARGFESHPLRSSSIRYVRTIPSLDDPKKCKYCGSRNIRYKGVRRNKSGDVRLMRCRDCRRGFSSRFGFRYRRHGRKVITGALSMHYSGMSVRAISAHFEAMGIDVNPATVQRWSRRYARVAAAYMDEREPETGNTSRAYEVWVNAGGRKKYLFVSMDDETRYWLAQELADRKEGHDATSLFRDTVRQAGREPETVITDGLNSYRAAAKSKMPFAGHVREIHITGRKKGRDNNRMERLNGTIRDREKTMRGAATGRGAVSETAVFEGLRVHYNHARRHKALKMTPGEAAGINVEGRDKWRTMIQNGAYMLARTRGAGSEAVTNLQHYPHPASKWLGMEIT